MDSLVAVDLLHIEDLSVARPNEWVLEQLYTVINSRYQDERSIVFTADVRLPASWASTSASARCRASRRCAASG